MGSKSKGSIISGVADYADASIDVSANEGVKIVGVGKGVGEALVDLKMPNSSGLAEKTRTSFSDALTTDLSSGYGRAITKQTRTQLKTFTLSVDTYANSTTGGYVGQSFDNLVNFLISSFLYRGQTNSIYGTKGDVLPVDNLRVQK